jgi:peroxiredoxin
MCADDAGREFNSFDALIMAVSQQNVKEKMKAHDQSQVQTHILSFLELSLSATFSYYHN